MINKLEGTVVLPHGTGKTEEVAVFIGDESVVDAKSAGADVAGNSTLLKDIEDGKMDFDVLITHLIWWEILQSASESTSGPKWLMPSPKLEQ